MINFNCLCSEANIADSCLALVNNPLRRSRSAAAVGRGGGSRIVGKCCGRRGWCRVFGGRPVGRPYLATAASTSQFRTGNHWQVVTGKNQSAALSKCYCLRTRMTGVVEGRCIRLVGHTGRWLWPQTHSAYDYSPWSMAAAEVTSTCRPATNAATTNATQVAYGAPTSQTTCSGSRGAPPGILNRAVRP